MNESLDIKELQAENKKLRTFISLLLAEFELEQRVREIRKNFADSDSSQRIIVPILSRISKIKSEKSILQNELHLD